MWLDQVLLTLKMRQLALEEGVDAVDELFIVHGGCARRMRAKIAFLRTDVAHALGANTMARISLRMQMEHFT